VRCVCLAVAVALGAVSCGTPSGSHAGPPGESGPSGALASSSAGLSSGSSTAIRVKDAYTAVTVRVLGPPTFPVLGTDNRYHVVYELELQNTAVDIPAEIKKLEVLDAANPLNAVVSYSDGMLVERLRGLPSRTVNDASIPPQQSRLLFVDFAFDSLDKVPKNVLHHLYARAADSPSAMNQVAEDYVVTPYNISAGRPVSIGPPLTGAQWIALNGCCEPGWWPHRSTPGPFSGAIRNPQRFAIDWKQVNTAGEFYTGDRTRNESYIDYGAAIIAVADGTVIKTLDTMEANTPGILPAKDRLLAPTITVETAEGNHIVLDLGNGVYAFYAHLIKGSLLVKPGDKVKKGQKIARLGNTGNSSVSHLHFHLMDGPSPLGSNGIPYVIDSFEYEGQISSQQIKDTDDYLKGKFFGDQRLPAPQPRTNELPLAWSIINFPQ
jgi:murein DD-endopeptidase MepM/ murein hydrolase activator NlpD